MVEENLTVLVVEPGKKPYIRSIPSGLASLQNEVGGYIQAVYPWDEPCAIICDEEGKLKNKPFNRALRDESGDIYDIITGTFLVVGLGEDNFKSLESKHLQQFATLFERPELFFRADGKIAVVPVQENE